MTQMQIPMRLQSRAFVKPNLSQNVLVGTLLMHAGVIELFSSALRKYSLPDPGTLKFNCPLQKLNKRIVLAGGTGLIGSVSDRLTASQGL